MFFDPHFWKIAHSVCSSRRVVVFVSLKCYVWQLQFFGTCANSTSLHIQSMLNPRVFVHKLRSYFIYQQNLLILGHILGIRLKYTFDSFLILS